MVAFYGILWGLGISGLIGLALMIFVGILNYFEDRKFSKEMSSTIGMMTDMMNKDIKRIRQEIPDSHPHHKMLEEVLNQAQNSVDDVKEIGNSLGDKYGP